MSRDWTFFLEDILDSAKKVIRYTKNVNFEAFKQDDLIFDAVVRNLEIIGEATKRLPPEILETMPNIEWAKAAAFRDVIAHAYFGLDIHIIWDVAKNKVPEIAKSVETVLEQLRGERPS